MKSKAFHLPHGYGSICYLGPGRSKPYAVYPPVKNGRREAVICYVSDWIVGFTVLTAWHAGTYYPGLENEFYMSTRREISGIDPSKLCERIIQDYARMNHRHSGRSVAEVYALFADWKYGENAARQLSYESRICTESVFSLLQVFHSRRMDDVDIGEWQDFVNGLAKKYSHSTVRNAVSLIKNLYQFALPRELCRKDYGRYVEMPRTRDEVHYEAFFDEDLKVLWRNSEDPVVKMILIMCYSGFRVQAYVADNFVTDLSEGYFRGGIKTESGRNRIVPIHSAIRPLVESIVPAGEEQPVFFNGKSVSQFRRDMKLTLRKLGLKELSPHSCRHTFSRLCESACVREADRKRLMGHSFGRDLTNSVYGHRTVEELRAEIEKIRKPS